MWIWKIMLQLRMHKDVHNKLKLIRLAMPNKIFHKLVGGNRLQETLTISMTSLMTNK